MKELTNQQIAEIYCQIENLDNDSIKDLINNLDYLEYPINPVPEPNSEDCYSYAPKGVLTRRVNDSPEESSDSLSSICSFFVRKFDTDIWKVILGKEKISEFALDVIQIVAPAIAQQYKGIPAMAIVAALTIICRNGITLYLTGNKTEI